MTALAAQTDISPGVSLLALASEKSSQKRLELLRRISDTFDVQNESTTVQYLLGEIVSKLLENFERGDRASASSILSRMPSLPEETADALAYDADFAVARPIIQDYPISQQTGAMRRPSIRWRVMSAPAMAGSTESIALAR